MNQQQRSDETIWPIFVFLGIVGVVLWGIFAMQPTATAPSAEAVTEAPTATPEAVAAAPTQAPLLHLGMPVTGDPRRGEMTFQSTCSACHGFNALGISGLGKPLVNSDFVNRQTDSQLVSFISQGRLPGDPLNTTGQLMPPRGGNMALSDDDLNNVVAYLRLLNQQQSAVAANITPTPTRSAPLVSEPFAPPPINALDASVVPPSAGASGELDLQLTDGAAVYRWACANCHGGDGRGVAPYGSDITGAILDDAALTALFSQVPAYSVGEGAFVHTFRGGYPELSDEQIQALVEYLHSLGG